jgi:fructose-1,6-bisphosphatase
VSELSELINRADKYYKDGESSRPAPERLNYVHVPKTKEEAAQARKIAQAVGDAQVAYVFTLSPPCSRDRKRFEFERCTCRHVAVFRAREQAKQHQPSCEFLKPTIVTNCL